MLIVAYSTEAGERRFFRGLVEGAKGAWRPGWRQVMIAMGGIRTSSSVNVVVVERKVGNVLLSPRALGAMVCLNKRVRPTAAWLSGGRGLLADASSAAPRQHEVIDQIVADVCPDLLSRDCIEVEVDAAVDAATCLLDGDGPEVRI